MRTEEVSLGRFSYTTSMPFLLARPTGSTGGRWMPFSANSLIASCSARCVPTARAISPAPLDLPGASQRALLVQSHVSWGLSLFGAKVGVEWHLGAATAARSPMHAPGGTG